MEKGSAGSNSSGCTTSDTCEHAPGTVYLSCVRARSRAGELSAPKNTESGITVSSLEPCPGSQNLLHTLPRKMDIVHRLYQTAAEKSYFDIEKLQTDITPADTEIRCITSITCGRCVSSTNSWLSSSIEKRSRACQRHIQCYNMCSTSFDFTRHLIWTGFMLKCVFILLLASLTRPTMANMDITAFEYQRKFHKPLDLGECPQREVVVDMGNNTFHIEEQRCTLHQRGNVTHLPRELNDSRNVLITSADGIVAYLGLCGGEAASFLGILNSGDCVAVEIASRLTFSNKTMVRAFVGYYRKSLDILQESSNHVEGMDRYLKDKFYLKHRSYGTLEIIFVQLRFDSVTEADEAKKIELSTPVMSMYMRQIQKKIGVPKQILVINLSTATQETYDLKQFKKEDWERAVRHVEILELTIQKTRDRINTNAIMPHLQYQLHPFVDSGDFRIITKPVLWEKTSMLEVQLYQAISLAKKTSKKCRGNQTKMCRRVRELRRKLITIQTEIHKGRSNWVHLNAEDKNRFSTKFTARVNSYSNVTKTLAKDVREMKKKEKQEKLEKKKKRLNQIPLETDGQPPKRPHPIRHAKSRNKFRGQGS